MNINKVNLVAILEPFINMTNIGRYMNYLGLQHCISNTNGHIWLMWKGSFRTSVMANEYQQITIKVHHAGTSTDLYITVVYAKCTPVKRKELWSSLEDMHYHISGPWRIRGDFNVILDPVEKKGGKPHRMHKSLDFCNAWIIVKLWTWVLLVQNILGAGSQRKEFG